MINQTKDMERKAYLKPVAETVRVNGNADIMEDFNVSRTATGGGRAKGYEEPGFEETGEHSPWDEYSDK